MKETRFKQTEIGLIPEDWKIINLKVLADSYIGLTYSPQNISKQGTLVLRSSNILNSFIVLDDCVYVNCNIPSRCIVKENDILVCVRNGSSRLIGKSALIPRKLEGQAFGAFMSILRPLENNTFLFYVWQSTIIQKQIKENLGATINQITNKDIDNYRIVYPIKKEERENIASALTSIDNLLLSLDKLIDKKRLIKQGVMQELLTGKKRLPGFNGEWVERRLGELTKICTGKKNGDESRVFGKYPFFVRSQKVYRIDTFSFDGEAILVPGEGGIGDIFHYINGKFDFHQRVYKISNFNPSIIAMYVYYFMKFYFKEYALAQSVKATVESLRLPTFENFIIRYPNNVQEQKAIATVLSSMDKEIESLEGEKAKYEQIKQGMMQQLLTGKIRLI